MANNRLSSAYRARGRASSMYTASLYDIENLGIEREASRAIYDFETEQRDTTLALISEGIGLASDIAGGIKSKKEFGKAQTTIQEGMAKKAYEGETPWGELGIEEKAAELAKFEPDTVKQDFSEWVFGAEKEYTFGKGEETFSKSQVTAAAGIYGSDRLSKLIGIDTDAKLVETIKEIQASQSSESNVKGKPDAVLPSITVDEIMSGDTKKVDPVDLSSKEGADKIIEDIQKSVQNVVPKKEPETLEDITKEPERFKPNIPGMDFDDTMGASTTGVKKLAKGGEFTTDGPEMILVGDNPGGKEKVTVKPIKSKNKEESKASNSLSDNLGGKLEDLVSRKGTRPGSKNWLNNYIGTQKVNNESLRPLSGELSKHNKKLFSMAEESGYFGEFFRGGWE